MKVHLALATSLILCAGAADAQDDTPAAEPSGIDLHEWGVFPVPRDADWAMLDLLAEWKTFPEFFQGRLPDRRLVYRGPVSKPVIWLHGQTRALVELEVQFSEGRPLIWWPSVEAPAHGAPWLDDPPGRLLWRIGVNAAPTESLRGLYEEPVAARPPPVPAGHWVEQLRSVMSAPVYSVSSHGMRGPSDIHHTDTFLYYDGVMRAPASPQARRDGAKLLLQREPGLEVLDGFCVERRDGRLFVASAWFGAEADADQMSVEMIEVPPREAEATLGRIRGEFVARSAAPGLNADEALVLGDIWEEGLLHRDGLTFFHRVSRATYDAWLPLKMTPAPDHSVRVGWVVHHRLEPELPAQVQALLARLGDPDATVEQWQREADQLAQIGGAAFPWMREALATEAEPLATRVRGVLEALDASIYTLAEPPAAPGPGQPRGPGGGPGGPGPGGGPDGSRHRQAPLPSRR